jgi:hypothetical protein
LPVSGEEMPVAAYSPEIVTGPSTAASSPPIVAPWFAGKEPVSTKSGASWTSGTLFSSKLPFFDCL